MKYLLAHMGEEIEEHAEVAVDTPAAQTAGLSIAQWALVGVAILAAVILLVSVIVERRSRKTIVNE